MPVLSSEGFVKFKRFWSLLVFHEFSAQEPATPPCSAPATAVPVNIRAGHSKIKFNAVNVNR